MEFSIKRPTLPTPASPLMDIISTHFFSFAIESYMYETEIILGLSKKMKKTLMELETPPLHEKFH